MKYIYWIRSAYKLSVTIIAAEKENTADSMESSLHSQEPITFLGKRTLKL